MGKALLIVLDGFGIRKKTPDNAIAHARMPHFWNYWKNNPHTLLKASGKAVGLAPGFIGNSEVGHLTIGAGRIVPSDLVRINNAIKDGSFYKNKVLRDAVKNAKKDDRALHVMGLLSSAGVHSHLNHLFALLKLAHKERIPQVYVHAFLDGRDVSPKSAGKYLHRVERALKQYNKNWKIATVMGRYYAMDRDNRWNREHKAYDAMVNCNGLHYPSASLALKEAYARGETDEFVRPSVIGDSCRIVDGDSVVFFNFRSDRARELTRAFVLGRFNKFRRKRLIHLHVVCLTQYDPAIPAPVAFPPVALKNTLGDIVSKAGLRQFRIAETEKWAHVTFFFNGLSGRTFKGEDRLLISSPKVTTYDKKPGMRALDIAREAAKRIDTQKYSFVLVNFANADMVGHTGKYIPTVKALEVLDNALFALVEAAKKNGYAVVITADHGNAEQLTGKYQTAHTMNPVPLIVIGGEVKKLQRMKGLSDVARVVRGLVGV